MVIQSASIRVVILSLFLNIQSLWSQKSAYKLFKDSIYPAAENDYNASKKLYNNNAAAYLYDPMCIKGYLSYSLRNNDVLFFKQEVVRLIYAGQYFSYADTLPANRNEDDLLQLIYEHRLNGWLFEQTAIHYPEYLEKNPAAFEFERFKAAVYAKDQLLVNYHSKVDMNVMPLIHELKQDSIIAQKIDSNLVAIYRSLDFANVKEIARLCQKYDRLPTNFDSPLLSRYIELSYFHLMKNGGGQYLIQTWELLHRYFEDAFIKGLVDDAFFITYDHYLERFYGVQYYGTRDKQVPLQDANTYNERKNRLKL